MRLSEAFPAVPMILDAGLGRPSHAAKAMEFGFDAVRLNPALAESGDPLRIALAVRSGVEAGRLAFEAGLVAPGHAARASTPEKKKGCFRMMIDPLYPIIDHPDWIIRLGAAGARLIQLRMKDRPEAELRIAIRAALAMAKQAGVTLVINDHWQLALDEGAHWVHLGQEDLDSADLATLRARGIRLGVSTHDGQELARALSVGPDYIALGPIFPTTIKVLRFAPQGIERIGEWKAAIAAAMPAGRVPPLVAIGGIALDTARACLDAGADSVAIVSDILKADDPDARCRALVAVTQRRAPGATA